MKNTRRGSRMQLENGFLVVC